MTLGSNLEKYTHLGDNALVREGVYGVIREGRKGGRGNEKEEKEEMEDEEGGGGDGVRC